MISGIANAVETPPRLYFSDARLSVEVPEPWTVPSAFPFGPMLTRKTQEGSDAYIVCQISDPVSRERYLSDVSTSSIKEFATQDITARTPGARLLAGNMRQLAGQNAYEITWITDGTEGTTQHQSIYFFMENRFYVLTLKAQRDSFPWIVQDFQNWLGSVRVLYRQGSGQLTSPSHGGLWVHQTGGAKISIPEGWLIGVSDDRTLGATILRDKMHLAFTAGADSFATSREFTNKDREEARKALTDKGRTVVEESAEPFHGLPAIRFDYEDTVDGRFIRGLDLWVQSPRARWLISVEGDARLVRLIADDWQGILSEIHFYE